MCIGEFLRVFRVKGGVLALALRHIVNGLLASVGKRYRFLTGFFCPGVLAVPVVSREAENGYGGDHEDDKSERCAVHTVLPLTKKHRPLTSTTRGQNGRVTACTAPFQESVSGGGVVTGVQVAANTGTSKGVCADIENQAA